MDRRTFLVSAGLASLSSSVLARAPTFVEGKNIFVETDVDPVDRTPTWYASMVAKPYAPVFQMLATRGTAGRYYDYTYAVTLKDMVKFHGHDCEGTTHAANNAYVAFKVLFPDGIIDRSVLWGISGTSPCWSDAVAFLTGARLQYGNLGFFRDARYAHAILLYRQDTGAAVLATWKKGINDIPGEPVMLPESIRWKPKVSMDEVMKLKKRVKQQGNPTPYQLDLLRYQQWKHINDILDHPLEESYQTKVIENFKWADWVDPNMVMPKHIKRSDVRYKNFPYRARPITNPSD
ncbi:MAG: FmdE family protein [Gammaproteobacteria bacterium]|jgi:formylmethanofuran dehydrogenase subunit E